MKDGKNTKKKLHQRNKHQELYNFDQLKSVVPELEAFIIKNPSGVDTIDFAIPEAVVLLNKAILMKDYKMTFWEMPKTNLCPPIPGRADYIHYIADLLAEGNNGKVPTGRGVKVLDLGIGANVIYPIIGVAEYGWEFVGSEVDVVSVKTASHIIENNPHLKSNVTIRKQLSKRNILKNIIEDKEYFDVVICNPPFFKSRAEVLATTTKKLKNLGKEVVGKPVQNFSGQNNELWCEGGEKAFITNYIYESKHFKRQAVWFTTLVSNKDNLKPLQSLLKRSETKEVRIINMEQGNKISRILAWRY
ncbi:23S rRNA (adenine(1618)-N(6))-methyltransferase RlmF [Myroides marinus]|uniref:Ribosomal RNA large subunit methyltransferase F n=1 Tax=Myroides marinus TaxID=703342 RepID=A0A1H6TWZ7_9FLAO|nr:23S rRNA (adenine(1618)-N(6))-methyltransferase RlmF [Myroides marinus]MDM1380053.1 23S rRNA (adenine(1618)-N(6))-methyltransferase RlmF [Myroides marinus]MDM1387290.1 23S rRNA (adenine(1618)-N(6))-methyltransferase RlmF [Myroides marinus]MDM1394537.1 23S rRNA (adenine(1618)-N(6))-methyltransferase RlmF [Myroides marinus]SEI80272.1 23S rRNA (adenine1618-N6)-methyltransferase [Myroides marinus]